MKKVLGMGNALVDVLIKMDDDQLLDQFGLPRGSMQLVDTALIKKILHGIEHLQAAIASGGSAANTINGLAALKIPCGYIGKTGDDQYGEIFADDMKTNQIETFLFKGENETGRAVAFISPDSERTFATYLGAAIELTPEDLRKELFDQYDIFHIEGYLVQNHALIEKAVQMAHDAGLKVSIDLASYNVVEANLEFLNKLVTQFVDIVFANEEESRAFTGKEPEDALDEIAKICDIAVVKIGKDGSLVKKGGKRYEVQAQKANPIDTTGAGDLYASGFLYGLSKGFPVDICGTIGSMLAGRVIEVVGAKMDTAIWNSLKKQIGNLS
jgi:sugar/nucleoside kinase (ribokinase family)